MRSTMKRTDDTMSMSDPASVPSSRVSFGQKPLLSRRTVLPWRRNASASLPTSAIASETMNSLPGPRLALRATVSARGSTWWPSAMYPAQTSARARAAPTSPGSRWPSPLIALKRWVTPRAPASKSVSASSAVQSA